MKTDLRIGIVVLILVAAFLRWPPVFANSFHSDEALYASFARHIATGRDPLLRLQTVDKPPLLFYLQSIFYPMMGPVEFAARLPNLMAALVAIPLLAQLVWRLYADQLSAFLAAGLLTLSPFAIQYSGTAFTDTLYVTLGLGSLVALRRRQARWSGLLFGLALATKYQALLYLPLLGAIWMMEDSAESLPPITHAINFLKPFGLVMVGLIFWLIVNSYGKPITSYGDVQLFADLRLIDTNELLPRLTFWHNELWYALGLPFAIVVVGWLLLHLRRKNNLFDHTILALTIITLASYWLIAFPTYNRYLLPLVPLLAIVIARFVAQRRFAGWIGGLILLLMLPNALTARASGFDFGGRTNADHGSAEIATYFKDAPYGTVLYDHWYSWQWRYHLYDKRVHVEWMPDAEELVENLNAFYDDKRYLALPNSSIADAYQPQLAANGYDLQPLVYSSGAPSIVLYKIVKSAE